MSSASTPPLPSTEPPQRVVKIRRDYNGWAARETMEDYALRFAPRSFRKWSPWRVANTAFGAASFLVLEAVGATLLVQYGFANAFWAVLATGLLIFVLGLPISVYAARHGVDMDLLTRGAGFGYIGSTITSLIYASFTFIFFALEAAVMAYAIELAFDVPPALGYLLCSLVVLPLAAHGVTTISKFQVLTQPLWIALLVLPYFYVFRHNPDLIAGLVRYGGEQGTGTHFDPRLFGTAMTVGVAMVTQMGEQADYLRFMPERTASNRRNWWLAVLVGGPGWVLPGVAKMLGGMLLAFLAISHMVPTDRAVDPNQMYLVAYEQVFHYVPLAVTATAMFVVISQLKINVTNAYAGSLAWSNFFSRVAHSHPGRVVWMVFNTLIALLLMEMNLFQALGGVMGMYANVAIAWMAAVVADLVINKPLGLSPPGIEFRRAYLYDINPVGVGATGIASLVSVAAHLGAFGPMAQAFSALIALFTALVAAPLIAWGTRGRYYMARRPASLFTHLASKQRCVVCEQEYEGDDMAQCPAYQGAICSLCCTLDARCGDLCKPQARLSAQWSAALRRATPRRWWKLLDAGLGHYLLLMLMVVPLLALMFGSLYHHEVRMMSPERAALLAPVLRAGYVKALVALTLVTGVIAWWLVLAHKSRQVAQEESNRQTHLLMREIESHRRTDEQLQQAKRAAELANQAKSRYITAISHELRTPLNSILGYAQLLDEDEAMPAHRKQAVRVIRRGGDHLLSLIEGTLDIARIEGGKLALEVKPMRLRECLREIGRMFELQAADRGLAFVTEIDDAVPEAARADERRLRQILINLLGNAVKFTHHGQVTFRVGYGREMARIDIQDSGPGMSAEELERVFEPFMRGSAAGSSAVGGTGLGLTIARMLTNLMGGEMTVHSAPGMGTLFHIRLFLPEVHATVAQRAAPRTLPAGYEGPRKRILVVDNEEDDRGLLASMLEPLGFDVSIAASGDECIEMLRSTPPANLPDAVLMDLAMPGRDGWRTLRCLREEGLSQAPAAIVSANAFDKGLDNDLNITPSDFIVKPVRLQELLDWLGQVLQLQWVDAAAPAAQGAPMRPTSLLYPPPEQLHELSRLVDLGYFRGVCAQLDEIEASNAAHAPFAAHMRKLACEFQFEVMAGLLRNALLPLRAPHGH